MDVHIKMDTKTMSDWLKSNAWAIVIGAVTLVSTYSLYGYRIAALETEVQKNTDAISSINTTGVQTQVALARLQTDMEYVKAQLVSISQKLDQK